MTNERPLYVFLIDDGAKHWIVASHLGEAASMLAEIVHGQLRVDWISDVGEVTMRRLRGGEQIRMEMTDADFDRSVLYARGLEGVPHGAGFSLFAEASACEWAEANGKGIIGSSEA